MSVVTWTERDRAANHLAGQQLGVTAKGEFYGEGIHGPDTGYVYFITLGEPAIWVKIGFTASNPFARMKSLQTGCPYPMKMYGFILSAWGIEQDLHSVLKVYRKQGEWFEFAEYPKRIIDDMLDSEAI